MVATRRKSLRVRPPGVLWIGFAIIILLLYSCTPVSLAAAPLHSSPTRTTSFVQGPAPGASSDHHHELMKNPAGTAANVLSRSSKLSRIQKKLLHRLNKPPVKTIQSPDGDLIDCVLSTLQPAFEHPLLKNHTIEKPPSFLLKFKSEETVSQKQIWHESGECPVGTVPIRRTLAKDILRAGSIDKYRTKKGGMSAVPKPSPATITSSSHENIDHREIKPIGCILTKHAISYMQGDAYNGAQATINVWSPKVDVPSEFSLSQIWILAGAFTSDLNSIEAGWQVSPDMYGDNNPRLFTYWTADGYQTTGCYNLLCSGFVQTSNIIAIGASISPVSSYGGTQYEIGILIWKDPNTGAWWMQFGENTLVGYWPASLFTHLAGSATVLEWGGEVVNSEPGGQHTTTEMGSGQFAEAGFGEASYMRNIQFVDTTNVLRSVVGLQTLTEQPNCYDIQGGFNSAWGNFFYYGGPGQNPNCP